MCCTPPFLGWDMLVVLFDWLFVLLSGASCGAWTVCAWVCGWDVWAVAGVRQVRSSLFLVEIPVVWFLANPGEGLLLTVVEWSLAILG